MKKTDLNFPFSWDERRPALVDQVFFVPDFYDKHAEHGLLEWQDVFGNDRQVHVEYCSGNGDWILDKAERNPHLNWVAVEHKFERVRKIWVKGKRLDLKNLIIVCGEALTFTKYYVKNNSLAEIYVNFPDPWPKEKHAKHRLIQLPFVEELSRAVERSGKAIFVTDHFPYATQMCEEMLNPKVWKSSFPAPYFTTEWSEYGTSFFDALWRGKGKTIHYMQFINESL